MAKTPFTLPVPEVTVGGKKVTTRQRIVNETDFEELRLLPDSVDMSTVLESQPHSWNKPPGPGVQMTCIRCSYVIRVVDEDADLDFVDLIAPCDQVIVEGVMDE